MPVAALVEVQEIAHARVVVGKAGGGAGNRDVDVGVAGDEEVGPPVPVHVADRSARVPAVRADAGRASALRKRAVAVVPEQLVVARRRHVEIRVAVAVEICGHAPLTADGEVRSRAPAHVGEATAPVAEQRRSRQATARTPAVDVGLRVRVHHEEIEPAVVVVVERAEPAAGHRRRVGRDAEAKRALAEIETDLRRDVLEPEPCETDRGGVARGSRRCGEEGRETHHRRDSPCEAGDANMHRVELQHVSVSGTSRPGRSDTSGDATRGSAADPRPPLLPGRSAPRTAAG